VSLKLRETRFAHQDATNLVRSAKFSEEFNSMRDKIDSILTELDSLDESLDTDIKNFNAEQIDKEKQKVALQFCEGQISARNFVRRWQDVDCKLTVEDFSPFQRSLCRQFAEKKISRKDLVDGWNETLDSWKLGDD